MPYQFTKKNNGFTLTEITTVVIIVGALAGLALPRFGSTIERVRAAEGVQILTALLGAQRTYELEEGSYATSEGALDIEITSAANFNVASIVIANNAANVAQIDRTGGYTLSIDEDGVISCACAACGISCAKAGH